MFTRRFSGLWGIVSLAIMALAVICLLVLFKLPAIITWGGSLFVCGLLLLQVISAVRGSAKRSEDVSTFEHNSLGAPVTEEFEPPYHCTMPFHSDESVLACYAPVMQVMSGLGDLFKGGSWSFLGKGKTTNAENALVLTSKRLFFVMIGPDTLRKYCPSAKITGLLEALPGDASAKRRMLWQVGATEVQDALAGLLAEERLEQVAQTHYRFSIPLSEISSVSYSPGNRTFKLQLTEQSLQYCLKTGEELTSLIDELTGLGLSCNE